MKVLLDSDILRYEIAHAAEAGWKYKTESDELPPWEYVQSLLHLRLDNIMSACNGSELSMFLTEGETFRYSIAKKAPYKANRKTEKPWHYDNLTVYFKDVLNANVVTGIEADDAMAIEQVKSGYTCCIASRDKDLRTIPGLSYGWELGRQPSFGPELIDKAGYLKLSTDRKRLSGTGLSFFYAQVLMGDKADNIPGLPDCGPVKAYDWLNGFVPGAQLNQVIGAYKDVYGETWDQELLEQGRLCWLVRRMNEDGSPQIWEIGMDE